MLAVALAAGSILVTAAPPALAQGRDTTTFVSTGAAQTWTVPAGVTEATFELLGAAGGRGIFNEPPGFGGKAVATIDVTPGEVLQVMVGGKGFDRSSSGDSTVSGKGGFNGGGHGGVWTPSDCEQSVSNCVTYTGGGGGGATDIRRDDDHNSTYSLAERLLVAGGGGGNHYTNDSGAVPAGDGGGGGGTEGLTGIDGFVNSGLPGTNGAGGGGGQQGTGGAGGGEGAACTCTPDAAYTGGDDGVLGKGGDGGEFLGYSADGGGGGGGGWYGGGGGGAGFYGAGGGGGSGHGPTGTVLTANVNNAPGNVKITFTAGSSPQLSIGDDAVDEPAAGTTAATFHVTRSVSSEGTATVHYATEDLTAHAGTDYMAKSGTLHFADGQDDATISVQVKADALDEPVERFKVALSDATDASVFDGVGVGTITDPDRPPSISVGDRTRTEGDAGTEPFSFDVRLSGPSGKQVKVAWTTTNGTAAAPADFTATHGTLVFTPGQVLKAVVVTVRGDRRQEGTERFFVDLKTPTNATIGDARGTGTIQDDD
jgi:hypothetical protein